MNPEAQKRLLSILAKDDSAIELHDLRFMRSRAAYLTADQLSRLNRLIKASGDENLKPVSKNQLPKIEVQLPEIVDHPAQVTVKLEPEDDGEPTEPGDEEDIIDDEPEDDGELEIVDGESDEDDTSDDEVVDVDEMNLDQLKSVATDLGIKGVHFYKDANKLREKILATYQTSNEAKAENEPGDTSEVI